MKVLENLHFCIYSHGWLIELNSFIFTGTSAKEE